MDWFKNWFDSFYYHKLYRHRNTAEAKTFIDNIISFIQPENGSQILDLACGKGRHSIYLNKKGFDVVGVDLSENSIKEANLSANEKLHFYQMDMREMTSPISFDLVMNMFTSFGYFQHISDNIQVLQGVHTLLKPDGFLVIDFLNATKVIQNLVQEETQQVDDIRFTINRVVEDNTVVKKIHVNDQGKEFDFQERVSMFELSNFKHMFEQSGFELAHCFGDYKLASFDPAVSDRLILVARKK
ncbi:MAG: cyclopropane fatty-acyl-phospholipid synthase-like methyltransferase [Salibacteraceae bacterium]